MDPMPINFRFLDPSEGTVLTGAIEAAYGSSYDVRWVYDPAEVTARLADGRYYACVAENDAGELLCHEGMSVIEKGDKVAHSGQAVTLPIARGQHVFTRTKQHLMDWARAEGFAGMFSEATAAHPYSQRANIDLGAHETGFLLSWIPATVSNDAAAEGPTGRHAAALFYTKLNDGLERPVYAPPRHREVVAATIELCELRGHLADPPEDFRPAARTELRIEVEEDHNLALLTVTEPGEDLEAVIEAERHHLFHSRDLDAVFVDLPLLSPATALLAGDLERLGVSYSGVFPNRHTDGDVLRMQSLHRVRVKADGIAVASDHGRELLDYVLADLPAGSLAPA
jgi:GNAT superfamily N-acetyltransferase